MFKWLTNILDSNEKEIGRLRPLVAEINALEPEFQARSDQELQEFMAHLRQELQEGDVTVDDVLPEVFAAVREAAVRTIGQRHYAVPVMGGVVLHQGQIAEMKTGDGKTLV